MNSRRKRPVPFQPKRLVTPKTGTGGLLKIEGETVITSQEKDSGQGPSILPSSRTEAATQYTEVLNPCIDEGEETRFPDPGLLGEITPAPPQPTPERLFSVWAMSGEGAAGQDLTLPHLTQGRFPQFAVQAPPGTGSKIRASTSPPSKRLPGITEPTDGRPWSGRKTALPPYYVKSSIDDVERLPAIHPSVWSSRGEKKVEYRGFITAPPVTATPPTTASRRGNMLQLNTIPLKRPSAHQKKEEEPAPCWRCALHLDHSKCESTKYIRIGGGYRHSYWFVQKMIERANEQELRRLALIRREERKIFQEKLMWRVGADGKRERRIKTFVRTSSGRKIVKYQYVPEDVFEDMMQLREGGSESAKRRLQERLAAVGISEDQLDTNWDPNDIGLEDIALDEEGNMLLDEFGEPIDMEDAENVQRALERRRKDRRRRGSEGSYADSGLAFDEKEEKERRRRRDESRRRRHRRRHSSDSRSYSESDGSDRSRSHRRRRRRHRRHRSDDSGASSDESGRSRRRHRRRRHRRRSGSEGSDYSSDSEGSRRRRRRRRRRSDGSGDSRSDSDRRHRRRRRNRRRDDSDDSYSGSDRSRSRRRRRRRRSYSDSSSGSRHRSRRHRRRRRRHSDSESDSYSDDSSYDSRSRRRRHRRHRKDDDDSSDSYSDDSRRDRRRRKDKKDRRRRRYSTSTEESSAGDEKKSKRDRRRDRRKKYYSDSESDSDESYRGRGKKKHRRPPRPPSTSSSDMSSEASSGALRGMTKEKRREYEKRRRDKMARKERRQEMREEYDKYVEKKERKKERRARRERGEPVSDSSSESNWGDGRTAVKYGRGSRRAHDRKDSDDYRDIGYDDPNDPFKKKDRRKGKKKDRTRRGVPGGSSDGEESSESEYYIDDTGKMKKKEKKKRIEKDGEMSSGSEESIYEDEFLEDGTVVRKKIRVPKEKKRKQRVYDDDELDAESEYESIDSADADRLVARQIYDKDGEVIRLTRSGRRIKDGKISKEVFDLEKHKQKKEKKKKEKQLLERGVEEEYIEEFIDDEGQVVRVVKKRLKGQTAPGRRPTTPLTGPRRVQVLFLKGGKHLQARLNYLLESCPLNSSGPGKRLRPISAGSDDYALDLDEREGKIDYLSHYQLVDPSKLESYGKAFVVEDTDENNVLTMNEAKVALEGIPSLQGLGPRQMHYILKILGIDDATAITFKMFAVVSALCGRLLKVIDDQTKQWMEVDDLMDLERKLELYRQMFYWNICSERSPNYIKASSLRVELIAGGVSRRQEDEVMTRIETNVYREVSFIDYMAFVPLFLCAHENIIENPLDNSRDKFKGEKEYVFVPEKDMVPLGRPMTRAAALDMKSIPIPYIFEKRPGSSPRKRFKLALPRPPVEEVADSDSFATPVMSPVPPKINRLKALKARMSRL